MAVTVNGHCVAFADTFCLHNSSFINMKWLPCSTDLAELRRKLIERNTALRIVELLLITCLVDSAHASPNTKAMSVQEAEFILRAQGRICYEASSTRATAKLNVTDVSCKVVAEGKSSVTDYRIDIPGNKITVLKGRDCRSTNALPLCRKGK